MDLALLEERFGLKINKLKLFSLLKFKNRKVGEFSKDDISKILDVIGFETDLNEDLIEAAIMWLTGSSPGRCFDKIQSQEAYVDILDVALNGAKDRVRFTNPAIQFEKDDVIDDDTPLF